MNNNTLVTRLALALAMTLPAAAFAADTTDIEVVNNGVTEKVSIEDLKVGETRQLYSEAGTLVTATRTAESLVLDIGGDKTTVPMIEAGDLSEAEVMALLDKQGGDGKKHVIRLHHAEGGEHAKAGGHRRVVVVDAKDGELQELDGDLPRVIVKDGAQGKQVIVKRHVQKAGGEQQ